jgi:hypothetical protein
MTCPRSGFGQGCRELQHRGDRQPLARLSVETFDGNVRLKLTEAVFKIVLIIHSIYIALF